jgi:hypothetical protein
MTEMVAYDFQVNANIQKHGSIAMTQLGSKMLKV